MTILPGTAMEDATATVYSTINGTAAITSLVTGVFNGDAPVDQAYPYISLGSKTEIPFRSFQEAGSKDINLTINIWSMQENDEEALAILNEVNKALDGKTLVGTVCKHLLLYQQGTPLFDNDLRIYNVPTLYRVISFLV